MQGQGDIFIWQMVPDKITELSFHRFGIRRRVKKNVGGGVMVAPILPLIIACDSGDGEEHFETDVGVGGHVLHYTADEDIFILVDDKNLSHGIFIPKIFEGGAFGQDDGIGLSQGRFRIPGDKGECEDVEK